MKEIRIKEKDKSSIRTLDRTAAAAHRIKDVSVRMNAGDVRQRESGDSEESYASGRAELYLKGGIGRSTEAAYGIAGPFRRRFKAGKIRKRQSEIRGHEASIGIGFGSYDQVSYASGPAANDPAEVGNPRSAITAPNVHISDHSTKTISVQARQKKYGIMKLTERNSSGRIGSKRTGAKGIRMTAERRRSFVGSSAELVNALTASGALCIGIIVVMVFFGAALTFNEDGSYLNGTGDATIVEVARGELGNHGGAKFWKWYGFKSRVDWCAIFVSWCANQCGYLRTGVLPKFAVVGDGARWFKSRHRWSGRGYKPKPGDFIFFDYGNDGVLDHVGIVESCDGKTVTTIEGNSSDRCRRNVYSVGNFSIAGYGLMVRTGGNKAKLIALWATQLAYPNNTREARYHGGKPTAAYAAALERAYPNRSGWGKPSRDGASCDVFVGTCLVDSGVDKDFPRGYRDQAKRLAKRTDLYECVVNTTSRNVKESELKDGDICTWEKVSGTVHIWIYAGGKARQAGHDKWYPRTTALGRNVRISGRRVIRIYRVKN